MCVYLHIYIYIYTHTHTHTQTYICICSGGVPGMHTHAWIGVETRASRICVLCLLVCMHTRTYSVCAYAQARWFSSRVLVPSPTS